MNNRLQAVKQAVFWLGAASLVELRNYLGWRLCPDREVALLLRTGELVAVGDTYFIKECAS